jgi:solute carrier family 13 (sodium-dependent dicarboxylate transporter), member 2/3/5
MLWITGFLPIPVSGILMIILFVITGVLSIEDAFSGLGEEIIWLITGVLIMGIAFEKTGLEKRLTYFLLSLAKGNLKMLLLFFIFSAFILTFFIPNGVARLTLMHSAANGITDQLALLGKRREVEAFYLAVVYAPYVTTTSLMTAASGSIYAVGLFSGKLNYEWNYIYWFLLMLPISIGSMLLLWKILCKEISPSSSEETILNDFFLEKRKSLDKIKPKEIKMLLLYGGVILLWATSFLHNLPLSIPALIGMISLFLPGISLIEWKDVKSSFDWGVLILFASGLALAVAFDKSGISLLLSNIAYKAADIVNPEFIPIILFIFIVLIRFVFTNFNASVAVVLPVVISFSLNLPFNSIWLTLLALVACSIAYVLPTQSFGSILIYSTGQVRMRDMGVVGLKLSIGIIVIALLSAYIFWPLMGLSIN